jgi:hypothetical protein
LKAAGAHNDADPHRPLVNQGSFRSHRESPMGGTFVSVRQRLHSDPTEECAPATGSDATPAVILEKVRRSCVGVNRLVLRHATRSTPESLVRSRDTTGVFEKNTRVFYVMPYQLDGDPAIGNPHRPMGGEPIRVTEYPVSSRITRTPNGCRQVAFCIRQSLPGSLEAGWVGEAAAVSVRPGHPGFCHEMRRTWREMAFNVPH